MLPLIAFLICSIVRGSAPGPLFCDAVSISGHEKNTCDKEWPVKGFRDFMRSRLNSIGVEPSDCERYYGHSIKGGAVQLYWSLGVRDEMIM